MPNNKEQSQENIQSEQPLAPTSKFQFTIGYNYQEIDNEVLIYDLLSDRSVRINATGKYIWDRLGKGETLADISNQFSRDYKIGKEEAFKICESFARQLHSNRLLSKYSNAQ